VSQLVYTQVAANRWTGRLLNSSASVDAGCHGLPVGDARFDITELRDGTCVVLVQGRNVNGRRYRNYPSLDVAQDAGIRWARRRFSVRL